MSIFGRPFVKRFALYYQTVVCLSVCLSVCLACDVGVLWPNGSVDQDETWHAGRPRPWPHSVTWGRSSPAPQKEAEPPDFWPIFIVAKLLDASRCRTEVGLSPRDIVLDGGPSSP